MSKHTAKNRKKTATGARAVRTARKARARKTIRLKRTVTRQSRVLPEAVEQQSLEPEEAELHTADQDAFGQDPESSEATIEIFEVEVLRDTEDTGPNE